MADVPTHPVEEEVALAAEELLAVQLASADQDGFSPMAVKSGSYSGRVPDLLRPPRPRAAMAIQVPVWLPPAPAILPGPA